MHNVNVMLILQEDGDLSLVSLDIDGFELCSEEEGELSEFECFSPIDQLDFWERIVKIIRNYIKDSDADINYFFHFPLPHLADFIGFDADPDPYMDDIFSAANLGAGFAKKLIGDYYLDYWMPDDAIAMEKAAFWYKKAAQHGLTMDLTFMGKNVFGKYEDYENAASCYQVSASCGDMDAKALLSELYLTRINRKSLFRPHET